MIREAERKDQAQLFELYRMLVPNSKKMNVLEEQIEKIRQDPNKYAIAGNVVVHEKHRNRHIGQRLFEHIEEYCKSMNCHRIMLLSNSTRQEAHRFFEREGFDGSVSKGFKKYL